MIQGSPKALSGGDALSHVTSFLVLAGQAHL
jgi:hypothetical protein